MSSFNRRLLSNVLFRGGFTESETQCLHSWSLQLVAETEERARLVELGWLPQRGKPWVL